MNRPTRHRFVHITDLAQLPDTARRGVVAIGNFDGVHRGHRAVIEAALDVARSAGVPTGILTFEPHPRTVFKPDDPVFRLTPVAEKRMIFAALGIDFVVEQPFDRAFASNSAADFVDRILHDGLGAAHVVTGFDFHFGKDRQGTPAFLAETGERSGFGVTIVPAFTDQETRPLSSSDIRKMLEDGDVAAAAAALGYRWFVTGPIIHGEKRGRDLGFPTANMRLGADCRLAHGVYAVRMQVDGVNHAGVANFGRRPQFDNGAPLLETYLFDFAGDLYDKTVAVELVGLLRPELKFEDVAALIAQMNRDAAEARALLEPISGEAFGPETLRQ